MERRTAFVDFPPFACVCSGCSIFSYTTSADGVGQHVSIQMLPWCEKMLPVGVFIHNIIHYTLHASIGWMREYIFFNYMLKVTRKKKLHNNFFCLYLLLQWEINFL